METDQKPLYKDTAFITGILFIILSSSLFFLTENTSPGMRQNANMPIFFINYLLAVFYLISFRLGKIFKFWNTEGNGTATWFIFLILALISAFALNREMRIFQDSATWLSVFLCVECLVFILLCLRQHLPAFIRYMLYFLAGAGLLLFAYFAIYLFPFYVFGLLAGIILGISFHVFVPLLICIALLMFAIRTFNENRAYVYCFLTGILVPLLFVIYFFAQWQSLHNEIRYAENETLITGESRLPLWISVGQKIPRNWISERLLKTDLVFGVPRDIDGFWRMPGRGFGEEEKHDPLVMTAVLFSGKPLLDNGQRIKILESLYDSRHYTQERLWTGHDLETSNVLTHIKIFPEYRLAYTEKTLSIHNGNKWMNNEEAIYTFHLPEGSVVTSLSLWINGIEEKGILTSKSKADTAYKTIVGVQRPRDPSVIHWQEGNTVSVRVFPCPPSEDRRVKIGVTTPLRNENNKLAYENIYFDGPAPVRATESIHLTFSTAPTGLDLPFSVSKINAKTWKHNGGYRADWSISFDKPALNTSAFSFNGYAYRLQDYQPKQETFHAKKIYLDLNSSWKKSELNELMKNLENRKVYAYNGELTRLTEENTEDFYEEAARNNFSLFPLHLLDDAESSLLISKGSTISPNLKDLKGCEFGDSLMNYLKETKKIRLFNLGTELPPYLKSLKELRVFTYGQGNMNDLANLLKQDKFTQGSETDSSIVIDNAQLLISRTTEQQASKAPDHLQRLFAYNHIMQQVSKNYFKAEFINEDIVNEAERSYVVSPVSSLIVLETQADYERFDIKASKDSLKNASMKSSGAVPEPHEWMLIILTACTVIYLLYKQYRPKFI
jgi:XrtN system VIT domain protein